MQNNPVDPRGVRIRQPGETADAADRVAALKQVTNHFESRHRFVRDSGKSATHRRCTRKLVDCLHQLRHAFTATRIHRDDRYAKSRSELFHVNRLIHASQNVHHRERNHEWFSLLGDKPRKFEMALELRRIRYQYERIGPHSGMIAFDDSACEFFFRGRRNGTVDTRQVDDA